MKVYAIPTPEKLFEAVDNMKWSADKKTAWEVANQWGKDGKPRKVALEFGKSAELFCFFDNRKMRIGTMYPAAARDYVKGLTEIEL